MRVILGSPARSLTMKFLLITILLCFSLSATADSDDRKAHYTKIIKQELKRIKWRVNPAFIIAMIEVETCTSKWSRMCWSPIATYRTKREYGVGLGMLTKTYYKNGRVRTDTLKYLKKKHRSLRKMSWGNIKTQPRLQIRAVILMTRSLWVSLRGVKTKQRIPMVISAYNQGLGSLRNDIRRCKQLSFCNPKKWYGHVNRIRTTSKRAHRINRRHVRKVMRVVSPKVKPVNKHLLIKVTNRHTKRHTQCYLLNTYRKELKDLKLI
jgi:hypothetical protein